MFNNMTQIESADYTIYFLAEVVDNNDPMKKQRVKIKIPNQIEENNPWVLMVNDVFFGTGSNYGQITVPRIGSKILVRFEKGDLLYGQAIGSTSLGNSSLPVLETNYPNRYGFIDPAGNHFYVDMTSGSKTMEVQHVSGTKIQVLNNGTINITGVVDLNATVTGNVTATVGGNLTANVSQNSNVSTGGNLAVSVGGNTSITSGGTTQIVSSGNMTLQAPRVDVIS